MTTQSAPATVQAALTPLQRYVSAYQRVTAQRAEEQRDAQERRARELDERHSRLLAKLAEYIPAEVLADWRVSVIENPYHDGPEIEMVPWFMIGGPLRVTVGTGFWYGRKQIRVTPAGGDILGANYVRWIDAESSREVVEEVLAAALFDGQVQP